MKLLHPTITFSLPALFLLTFLNGCMKNDSERPVVDVNIGVAVSLSGDFWSYGPLQRNGITMAINEINGSNHLPGFRLVAHIADDKSMPDTCRKIFQDLILLKKVVAIIGPTSSNSAFAADTVAQNHGVVVIGISNTIPGITEMGNFIFRNSLPESSVIPNTVRITHDKLAYSRVSIIFGNDDPYTIGAYNSFRAALKSVPGISVISTDTVHKGDEVFTGILERVTALNPDVIVLATLVNETARIMIQARSLGLPVTVPFLGGNSFNTAKLWQQAGVNAQGALCGSAWIHTEDSPGNAAFVGKYFKLYGSMPDQFAAQAYASIYILADALKRSGKADSQSLRDALAQTSNLPTVLGSFSFDPTRNPVHPPVVQQLVDGEFKIFE